MEHIGEQDMDKPETGLRMPTNIFKHAMTWRIDKFSEEIVKGKVSSTFEVEPLSTYHISLAKETNGIGLYLHRHSEDKNFQVYFTVEVSDAEHNMFHFNEDVVLPTGEDSSFDLLTEDVKDRMLKIMDPVDDALIVRLHIETIRRATQ